ncbi:MAG: hypothetical protein AB1576_06580 [Bacillota bacterium]
MTVSVSSLFLGLWATSSSSVPIVTGGDPHEHPGSAGGIFPSGLQIPGRIGGIFVGAKQVEATAKKLGATIATDEAAIEEKPNPSDTMYAVDGTGIPMRPNEVACRPGK